jgi:hypothetical protein
MLIVIQYVWNALCVGLSLPLVLSENTKYTYHVYFHAFAVAPLQGEFFASSQPSWIAFILHWTVSCSGTGAPTSSLKRPWLLLHVLKESVKPCHSVNAHMWVTVPVSPLLSHKTAFSFQFQSSAVLPHSAACCSQYQLRSVKTIQETWK